MVMLDWQLLTVRSPAVWPAVAVDLCSLEDVVWWQGAGKPGQAPVAILGVLPLLALMVPGDDELGLAEV